MMDAADIGYENTDLLLYQKSPNYWDNLSKTIEDNNQACTNNPIKSVRSIDSIDNPTDLAEGEPCVRPPDYPDRLGHLDHPDRLCPLDHRPSGTAEGSLGRIIQAFKSLTTHEYITGVKQNGWSPFPGKLWQRNYHEHIIRNKQAFQAIRNYIMTNPLRWHEDKENPKKCGKNETF